MNAILFTIFALVAFAGNSVLCKLALDENIIDAGSFTSIRLLSGIVTLLAIYPLQQKMDSNKANTKDKDKGSWFASVMLFIYAVAFSYAYINLDTGTGALILFASVQITILCVSFFTGNKLLWIEWLGLIIAFLGFIYLVIPNISTPSFGGFILMSIAGVAWGMYTLAGKGSLNPLSDTTFNFVRTAPLILLLCIFTLDTIFLSSQGILLAVLAGSITSGLGYTIWYIALREISAVQAAVVQLLVPVIAAIGGVIFINEQITARLVFASLFILLGIFIVIFGKQIYAKRAAVNVK